MNPGTTNLVAYYSLDESSGTRADSHSNGYDLTDNNTVTSRTGVINNGSSHSGSSEYLSSATAVGNALGNGVTAMTISMWIKADVTNSNDGIISVGTNFNGTDTGKFNFNISGTNKINTTVNGVAQTVITFSDTTNWHHLAVQYRGSTVAVWLDGTEQFDETAASGTSINCSGLDFIVGGYFSSSFCFDGGIDEVGVWSSVLTDDNITWLYNSGSGRSYADISGGGGGPAFTPKVMWFAQYNRGMSNIDPETQLHVKEEIDKVIKRFDEKLNLVIKRAEKTYAIKLVEKIVFYAVGAVSVAVLGALIKLVVL